MNLAIIVPVVFVGIEFTTVAWCRVSRNRLDREKSSLIGTIAALQSSNARLTAEESTLLAQNAELVSECKRLEKRVAESEKSAEQSKVAAEQSRIQCNAQQTTLTLILSEKTLLEKRCEKLQADFDSERAASHLERQKTEKSIIDLNEARKSYNSVLDETATFVRSLKAAAMLWEMYKTETYKLRALLLKKGVKIEQMKNDAERAHVAESSALDMFRLAETWEKSHSRQ
jgi:hypothetical protein